MRQIVELSIGGTRMVGTLHRPDGPSSRTGVLLLNAGHVPRDGHGGLSVVMAERLCALGHPTWRVDFPGFGDSPGELPEQIETFWGALKRGGLVPLARGLVDAIRAEGEVDGLVVGGVCGAAITAIYTADRQDDGIRGLLMLEPEFFVTDDPSAAAPAPRPLGSRLTSTWGWLRVLTGASRYGRRFPGLRRVALNMLTRHIELPERTNLELAHAWWRLVHSGIPTLVITSAGSMWEVYYRQVTERITPGAQPDNLRHVSIADANHVFTQEEARAHALDALGAWARDSFRASTGGPSVPAAVGSVDAASRFQQGA